MLRRTLVLVVTSCGPGAPDREPPVDAEIDAYSCVTDLEFTQTVIAGTSPIGSFDGLTYVVMGGQCGGGYGLMFVEQPLGCPRERVLRLSFPAFEDDGLTLRESGEIAPASAHYAGVALAGVVPDASTEQVEFRISYLDSPYSQTARVSGRFVSTAPDWMFDISIDLISAHGQSCL